MKTLFFQRRNTLINLASSLALLLGLAACTAHDPHCANLPGSGRYCLQPTTALMPFEVQQKVEAAINGRRETMIVEIESDSLAMRMVGLTPFGHKLVQVSYDNHEARAETLPDRRLSPTLLVALLQLTLWPVDNVRTGLDNTLKLEESTGRRRLLANGKPVLDIHYGDEGKPPRHMHLSLPSAGLELEIETLSETEKE